MELGTFTPRAATTGDQLQAKEAVDRPLVVLVREHRTGIKTQYKPDGDGVGVIVDIADVSTDDVWIDVLWMNAAVVDNLAPYVAQVVPVKLVWTPSAKGGNAYIGVEPLDGDQLEAAKQWAGRNPDRFNTERASRAATAAAQEQDAPPTSQPMASVQPIAPAEQPAAAPAADPTQDPAVQALIAQLAAKQQAS